MEGFVGRLNGRKKPMQMPPGGQRARAISFFFFLFFFLSFHNRNYNVEEVVAEGGAGKYLHLEHGGGAQSIAQGESVI